jgi:hypothetical protein
MTLPPEIGDGASDSGIVAGDGRQDAQKSVKNRKDDETVSRAMGGGLIYCLSKMKVFVKARPWAVFPLSS